MKKTHIIGNCTCGRGIINPLLEPGARFGEAERFMEILKDKSDAGVGEWEVSSGRERLDSMAVPGKGGGGGGKWWEE